MGYYVSITECDFCIPKRHHEAAYNAVCKLNDRDDLKQGGSWGGDHDARKPRPAGLNYHPGKWFSWMDADYPSKCTTLEEVLQMVGFEVALNEKGDIVDLRYDNKTGQEDLFLAALAPFVQADSYITWRGEEGELFRHEFNGRAMLTRESSIVWH